MSSCKPRHKPNRIAVWLSDEDDGLLQAIISHERDSASNVMRRMIRSHHSSIFSPRQQSLTLLLPQSSSDFANLSNTIEKDPPK